MVKYICMNYTMQCTDAISGEVGCFFFDIPHWVSTEEFKATSPVFSELSEFFKWAKAEGLQIEHDLDAVYSKRI